MRFVPGESCYAQLRLSEDLAARQGDRFVVRFYSPLETIGGGVILDEHPYRHKRHDEGVLAALAVRENGSDEEKIVQGHQRIRRRRYGGCRALRAL